VLVVGEWCRKKVFKNIHSLSHRKHGKYIAVNCGAIPEERLIVNFFDEKALLQGDRNVKVILK
jgi:transcriptional regulator with PAS, ATPase and Fis domain